MRIVKRILRVGPDGRILQQRVILLRDEDGLVESTEREHLALACANCGRPAAPEDLRGGCGSPGCGLPTCLHCQCRCVACGRSLCRMHVMGWPDGRATVCARCLADLAARRWRHDLMEEREADLRARIDAHERRQRLLESRALDGIPLVNLVRAVGAIALARRLAAIERRIGEGRR